MILPFFRRPRITEPVLAVYSAIVAQSRLPVFYARWGVPDTLTGRFDMISLHAALVFRRLRSSERESKDFAQDVFDCFFRDMDRSLREMGVGDLSVGKRIEKMGSLFYGLLANIGTILDSGDRDALIAFIARNFHDDAAHPEAGRFADYVFSADRHLSAQPVSAIVAGTVSFEEPK